jgi:exopolyphosphatase/guanosine-5'-triphosphate,3'-diphosphate pyrophosphatase
VRIAALDLGTNSFHLLVAEVHGDGHFESLVREKEMLRLGDAVARHGRIPEVIAERAVETVRRFRLLADAAGATEIVACATSAVRSAANGDAVVDRIEDETDVDVRVIDGLTEAQLIFRAIRESVLLDPAPALCFDLGGGSVEVMVGDAAGLCWASSQNLGVGRLTAELVESDPLSKADRRGLRDRIESVLAPVAQEVARFHPRMAVGTSGTLLDIAHMVAARRGETVPASLNQLTIDRDEFLPLHKEIISSKAAERRRLEGLEARRVELIPAGSMFLAIAMELFDFEQLTVSQWALREGILLDAIGRHDPADWSDDPRAIRRASVQGLARRYDIDLDHSQQVAHLALLLFDQTTELHGLDAGDRELLEYAALLHNIGQHVAVKGHHKHAAYLIRHGELRGFAPTEVALLAAIARWHRKGEPRANEETGPLSEEDEDRLRKLTALLRLADGLDRSHHDVIDNLRVRVGPSLVRVYLDADGSVELEQWAARRRRALFEKVFDRELEVTTHPAGRRRGGSHEPVTPGGLPPSDE